MKKIRNLAILIGIAIVCYDTLKYFSGLYELQLFISCLFLGAIFAYSGLSNKASGQRSTIHIRIFRERLSKRTIGTEALITLFMLYLSVLSVWVNDVPRSIGFSLLTFISEADALCRWLELRKLR
jgi:hypothetical protein